MGFEFFVTAYKKAVQNVHGAEEENRTPVAELAIRRNSHYTTSAKEEEPLFGFFYFDEFEVPSLRKVS